MMQQLPPLPPGFRPVQPQSDQAQQPRLVPLGGPDPARIAAERRAEAADARATSADLRAADAAARAANPVPAGYRQGADGNLQPIPGGPADPSILPARRRQLPMAAYQTIEQGATGFRDLTRLANTFNNDFSGFGSGIENSIDRWVPFATEGQNQWWADLNAADNILRHALFGASLTAGEQAAWERTTVTPNMRPELIRTNLARRQELTQELLQRRARTFRTGGYNEEQIREALGQYATILDEQPPQASPAPPPADGAPPGYHVEQGGAAAATGPSQRGIQLAQEADAMFNRGASAEELNAFAQRSGYGPFGQDLTEAIRNRDSGRGQTRFAPPEVLTPAGQRAEELDRLQGPMGQGDIVQHGAMLGLGDEAAGVGGALANIVTSPFTGNFDPVGAYQTNRDADEIRLNEARSRAGTLGTIEEIGGGLASGNPTAALSRAFPTLLSRIGAGSRAGGEIGLLSGYGHGRGAEGSAIGAVGGAAGGALIGGAIPAVGAGANALYGFARTATGRNPNLARTTVANALESDLNTPRAVGRQMQEAQANDVPYMLADSGDNARGLLAASTRAPGPARTLARDALETRQAGSGERVAGAVERDLGPASNPHEVNDALMARAQAEASPLYEQAYARPGAAAFARRIMPIMSRPAMRQAMARARAIAEEEGRDPAEIGLVVRRARRGSILEGEQVPLGVSRAPTGTILAGEVTPTVSQNPTWQTFDYIKRGLDDVLQAQPRDPATGRLILDEATRAIQATRRAFVAQFDRANPQYAAARAAWAGPARAREAMDIGRGALKLTADDLTARTRDMSPNEMEFLRLGVRRAIVEAVAGKGDTANVVNAVIGTPKRRAMLARLFGGRAEFNRFVSTLQAEREGHRTFARATQGSPTAQNLGDDSALSSAIGTGIADMATTGLPVGTAIKQAIQYGTGRSGRQAQQEIAALLSETDPARLMELSRELRKEAFRRRARGRSAGRRAQGYGTTGGQTTGIASED